MTVHCVEAAWGAIEMLLFVLRVVVVNVHVLVIRLDDLVVASNDRALHSSMVLLERYARVVQLG
jgi:hypothetical protein